MSNIQAFWPDGGIILRSVYTPCGLTQLAPKNTPQLPTSRFNQRSVAERLEKDRGLESVETINIKASSSPILTGCSMVSLLLYIYKYIYKKRSFGHHFDP